MSTHNMFSSRNSEALLMSTHNTFSSRNEKNVNIWASKSWLDKWILTNYLSVDK